MTHRNRNILIGSALLMVLMVFSYALIDRPLTLFCQDLNPEAVQVFQWITKLGKSTGYLVVFFVLFVFFKYYLRRPIAANRALFLFAAVALSGLATDLIKPLVGRLRPKLLFEADLYGFDPFRIGYEYNSFPSGHATTVFALAAALSFFFPRWRLPLFSLAAVVGLSRIIVGAHYLSDVMAGAYVGVMTVFALVLFCRRSSWIHCRLDRNKENDHA
jgi:membrane-associated phospholipid phosphatase